MEYIAHRSYHKYIFRKKVNGKWRYWYKLPSKRETMSRLNTVGLNQNLNENTGSKLTKSLNRLNQLDSQWTRYIQSAGNARVASESDTSMSGNDIRNEKKFRRGIANAQKTRDKAIQESKNVKQLLKQYGLSSSQAYRPHARPTMLTNGDTAHVYGYVHRRRRKK